VKQWQQKFTAGKLIDRDIGKYPIPHLLQDSLEVIVAPENITSGDKQTRDLSNKLIEEIKAADMIVFGVPMHNLSIPSTLKAYFDHIAVTGKTWGGVKYGKDKHAVVITTGGSLYEDTKYDFQVPYIKAFLKTIDLKNVTFIRAHGLCKSEQICKQAIINARSAIKTYLSQIRSDEMINNYLQKGDEKFAVQQYAEAIEEYSAGIALAPDQPVFYVNRAEAKRQLKDLGGCTEDLVTAIALDNQSHPQIGYPYYRVAKDLAKKHLITNSSALYAKFSHKAFRGFIQELEKNQQTLHSYLPYTLYYLG
jgi:FMN-dependent NADH-azoreductase